MDSLRMLLAERDYAEISIGDIAERATVNRATFYAHYTDKQDLLAGMLRQEFEDLIFTRLFPGVPFRTENVVALSVVVFQFMGSLLGGCAKKASELGPLASPIVQETLCVHIKKWLEVDPDAMTYFSGASRSAVAGALSWSIYGGALEWSRLAHRKPADKASKEIVSLFLR
jgi:AcrR family transcriptional regulator